MIINNSSKADETYTIEQFCDMGSSDPITYRNMEFTDYINGFEYSVYNLIYDYIDEIEDEAVIIKLDDKEFLKYMFKPWLLAYDIYGSEEAGFILKILNGVLSDSEFTFKRVKALRPATLSAIVGRIESNNAKWLNDNRSQISEKIKADSVGNNIW